MSLEKQTKENVWMELFRNVIANANWIKRQKSCRLFQSETKDQPEATRCLPFVTINTFFTILEQTKKVQNFYNYP